MWILFSPGGPKVCCVPVTGLEDQLFQILLLSVVVSGKGNRCNSCQSAFLGAGEKNDVASQTVEEMSAIFTSFLPPTYIVFPLL